MDKVSLNGVEIFPFDSEQQLLHYVDTHKGILVAINAEKILHATEQTRAIINRNIGYCDGAGAQMALKQKGYKDAYKIPGCELWLKIITRFYKEKTFYLVGGKPQIVNETVEKLCSEYQDIRIVGYRNGYIKTIDRRYCGEETGCGIRGYGVAKAGIADGGDTATASRYLPRIGWQFRCLYRSCAARTEMVGGA